ncbi:type II CRISPR RNA-guided endonuclease Cas9 [Candidatus Neomarinimicrobiota bacterium]
MTKILGLDLGPNSIGWALIHEEEKTILGAGVRVFQEGVANLGQGDREVSWNKQRRDARGTRRNIRRYRQRRNQLKTLLIESGMMPEELSKQDVFFRIDPYKARKQGLHEKLPLYELGRAIYHINQRRGFKSNRKMIGSEDSKIYKGSEGKTGITATDEAIKASGSASLGEYLALVDPHEERRRNRYTLRQMYKDEFDKLWDTQVAHWPSTLSEDLRKSIYDTIFYQRSLRSQKHTIGYCTLEPSKRRAPISSPTFQRYRILEQVNRLRVSDGIRYHEPLTPEERAELIDYLEERKDASFDSIKKKLKLPLDANFNLEDQGKIKGNRTYKELAKIFGKKRWAEIADAERLKIWHTLHFADDPVWLKKYAEDKWGLGDEAVKKLDKTSFETGYAHLSQKAMGYIITFLEMGFDYDVAVVLGGIKKAFGKQWEQLEQDHLEFILDHVPGMVRANIPEGFISELKDLLRSEFDLDETQLAKLYHHSLIEKYPKGLAHLPEPKDLRNPLVQQAMYELRRVVNAIVNELGKPDIIRVELVRDLKLPKRLRQQITKDNRAAGEKAKMIRKRLKDELNFTNPSREDIHRYLLWEELGTDGVHTCPYTGRAISLSDAYSGDFEIEHILPYSRSIDDSMANKTLCWKPENQAKGEHTPYEVYSHDTERYTQILARVKKAIPHKLRKFKQETLDEDFINRQLVDAAYFSREAHSYLQSICDRVEAVSGRTTARLRKFWGLNRVLSGELDIKIRDDHRHHAVDALVVVNTTPDFVRKLSLYNEYHRQPKQEKFGDPWPTFRADVQTAVNRILISHRVKSRPRGKIHEETYYGQIQLPGGGQTFVVRKPLDSLTPSMARNIVDGAVQKAVAARLAEFGVTDITGSFSIPREAFKEPLFLPGVQYPVKSVRIKCTSTTMRQLYTDRNLWVEPGSNHHVVIFRDTRGKQVGSVVPLLEVVSRKRQGLALIEKEPPEGCTFLMSLTRNDMVLVDVGDEDIDWTRQDFAEAVSGQLYRVQKLIADGRIILRHHTVAMLKDEQGNEPGLLRKSISTLAGIKVKIDPFGRIKPAYD